MERFRPLKKFVYQDNRYPEPIQITLIEKDYRYEYKHICDEDAPDGSLLRSCWKRPRYTEEGWKTGWYYDEPIRPCEKYDFYYGLHSFNVLVPYCLHNHIVYDRGMSFYEWFLGNGTNEFAGKIQPGGIDQFFKNPIIPGASMVQFLDSMNYVFIPVEETPMIGLSFYSNINDGNYLTICLMIALIRRQRKETLESSFNKIILHKRIDSCDIDKNWTNYLLKLFEYQIFMKKLEVKNVTSKH